MATAGPFQGADGVRLDDEQAGPGPAILDEKNGGRRKFSTWSELTPALLITALAGRFSVDKWACCWRAFGGPVLRRFRACFPAFSRPPGGLHFA